MKIIKLITACLVFLLGSFLLINFDLIIKAGIKIALIFGDIYLWADEVIKDNFEGFDEN